eukprot:COSAG04_NODE_897_length_9581_cov_96.260599_5_plen_82_part_00
MFGWAGAAIAAAAIAGASASAMFPALPLRLPAPLDPDFLLRLPAPLCRASWSLRFPAPGALLGVRLPQPSDHSLPPLCHVR